MPAKAHQTLKAKVDDKLDQALGTVSPRAIRFPSSSPAG